MGISADEGREDVRNYLEGCLAAGKQWVVMGTESREELVRGVCLSNLLLDAVCSGLTSIVDSEYAIEGGMRSPRVLLRRTCVEKLLRYLDYASTRN